MIYVECKPDFTLVKSLGIPKREITHGGNKPEVLKRLEKKGNCKGLIDEDPLSIQPPNLKKFRLKKNFSNHEVKVLADGKGNELIVVCPRLEDWLVRAAKEFKIKLEKYNLPSHPVKLHKVINIDISKFKRLIEDLKKGGRLKILKRLLKAKK